MQKYLFFLFLAFGSSAFAQSILGTYSQVTFSGPQQFRNTKEDVVITRDPQSSKKIWISGLVSGHKMYAMLDAQNEDGAVYNVPKQKVGAHDINLGCIVYDNEERTVTISLNDKQSCMDSANVSVGQGGVSAGGVKVGSDGTVKAPGVNVGKNGNVAVNTQAATQGITYIGKKKKK